MVMNEGSHNSACDSCTTVMSMVDISVFACGMALPKGYVIMRISAWIWNAKQAYKIYNYIYIYHYIVFTSFLLMTWCGLLKRFLSRSRSRSLSLVNLRVQEPANNKNCCLRRIPWLLTHTHSLSIYIYTRIRRELSAVRHLRFCQCLTCSVGSSKHHAHYSEYQNQDYAISI